MITSIDELAKFIEDHDLYASKEEEGEDLSRPSLTIEREAGSYESDAWTATVERNGSRTSMSSPDIEEAIRAALAEAQKPS